MTTTRRTFLKIAGAASVAAAAAANLGASCGPQPVGEGEGEGEGTGGEGEGEGEGQPPPNSIDCGKASSLPTGVKQVANKGVLVGRDAGGIYAMSAICTHAGCDMSFGFYGVVESNGDVFCECHGSTFSPNGDVVGGPARSSLVHYQVTIVGDEIFVQRDVVVSKTTRVAG